LHGRDGCRIQTVSDSNKIPGQTGNDEGVGAEITGHNPPVLPESRQRYRGSCPNVAADSNKIPGQAGNDEGMGAEMTGHNPPVIPESRQRYRGSCPNVAADSNKIPGQAGNDGGSGCGNDGGLGAGMERSGCGYGVGWVEMKKAPGLPGP